MAGTSEGARKAAQTKGAEGRSRAARKATQTRSRQSLSRAGAVSKGGQANGRH